MSDVFELPVQVSAILDNSRFKPTSKKDIAATVAINAYDANQQEIALQDAQLIDANNEINDQKVEITELKSQHNESCTKWRDQFESMHQRAMKAERENAELKSSLQSVKADTLNDLVEVLRETGPPNQIEASVRTHNSICNSIEGVIKIMREGES
jgi:hypothetical protein